MRPLMSARSVAPGPRSVRLGERLAHHHLARGVRLEARPARMVSRLSRGPVAVGDRDQRRDHRLVEVRACRAWRGAPPAPRPRCTPGIASMRGTRRARRAPGRAREHVGEAGGGRRSVGGLGERVDHGERGDQHRDAGGDDDGDGDRLPAQPPQVAQQLAVQRVSSSPRSSAGATALALRSLVDDARRRRSAARGRPCRRWRRCG